MRWLKMSAGVVLVLGGVVAMVGCIWIPDSHQRVDGRARPETQVGEAGSNKPLRLNEATRADVERVLGAPMVESNDHRRLVYQYDISTGTWLLCFVLPQPTGATRYLRLDFDEEGRLKSYRVFKDFYEAGEGRFNHGVPSVSGAEHG